jgi:hypothetical protein
LVTFFDKNRTEPKIITPPKHIYAWKAKLADAGGSPIRITTSTKRRELTEIRLKHKEP